MWIFLVVLKRMAKKWTQNYNAVMSTACVDSQFTLCRCRCGRFAYFLTSSNRMNGKRMNSQTSTKQLKAHWTKRQLGVQKTSSREYHHRKNWVPVLKIRGITLDIRPLWGIHSLTLIISCYCCARACAFHDFWKSHRYPRTSTAVSHWYRTFPPVVPRSRGRTSSRRATVCLE